MRFDPYREWLGIPPGPRPPHPYALLGLPRFERDVDRIANAAETRARSVRHQAPFDRVAESQQVLKEIQAAREVLTDPRRRRQLDLTLRRAEKRASAGAAPALSTTADPSLSTPAGWRQTPFVIAIALAVVALLGVGLIGVLRPSSEADAARPVVAQPVAEASASSQGPTVDSDRPAARPEPPREQTERPQVGSPRRDVAAEDAVTDSPASNLDAASLPQRADETEAPAAVDSAAVDSVVPHRPPVVAARPAGDQRRERDSATRIVEQVGPVEARRPQTRNLAGYRLPSFATAGDATAYAEQLRQLLAKGLEFRGGDLNAVQQHHREAVMLAGDDAALADYALGLVYWKRLRLDESRDRLEASRGTAARPFLPAWRASIQLHLKRSQRDAALREIVAMAQALAAVDGTAETTRARDDSLRWLGRLTAALESPWIDEALPPQDVIDADAAVREALDSSRQKVYEQGRRSLRDDVAVLREQVQETIGDIALAHSERQAEELTSIASEREAARGRQATIAKTAEEWEKELETQTGEIDDRLEKLIPQYQQLAVQVDSAWSTLALINDQIALALEQPADQHGATATFLTSPALLAAREQALARYRVAAGRANEVRQQVEALAARRRMLAGQYEQATQKLLADSEALKKWDNVLQRRAGKAEATEVDNLPAVRTLRRQVREVGTYVPFDLDAERDTILAVLGELDGLEVTE